MKKLLVIALCTLCLLGLSACNSTSKEPTVSEDVTDNTIKVIATLEPHATILEAAKDELKEKGYELEIIVVDDYYTPNRSVNDGEADANFFQHVPFFDSEVANNGYELVNAGGIHIEPFGFYSNTVSSIDELKDGDTIVISNSPSDNGRILNILQQYGLVTIKEGVEVQNALVETDIAENPKNLQFIQVKPEMLTLALENNEGALVAINGNYALTAGLNPVKDAIILEKADNTNPYVNIIACRKGEENSDKIQALVSVLQGEGIREFITTHYSDGSVIPSEAN